MAEPIACPHCHAELTDAQVRSLNARVSRRKRGKKAAAAVVPPDDPMGVSSADVPRIGVPLSPMAVFQCSACGSTYHVRKPFKFGSGGLDDLVYSEPDDPGCPACAARRVNAIERIDPWANLRKPGDVEEPEDRRKLVPLEDC